MSQGAQDPGWYTADDGTTRYWDGERWLAPTPPPVHHKGAGSRRGVRLVAVLAGSAIVLVLAYLGLQTHQLRSEQRASAERSRSADASASASRSAEASASASASRSAAAARAAEAQEQERITAAKAAIDAWMNSQSGFTWEVIESGDVYARFADDDEYTCGLLACTSVVVTSRLGCPGGVYVEASVTNAGTVVGMSNDLLGALPAEGTGQVILTDTTGQGDTFLLSDVNCRK